MRFLFVSTLILAALSTSKTFARSPTYSHNVKVYKVDVLAAGDGENYLMFEQSMSPVDTLTVYPNRRIFETCTKLALLALADANLRFGFTSDVEKIEGTKPNAVSARSCYLLNTQKPLPDEVTKNSAK